MTLERAASICFSLLITSAIAQGQQQAGTAGQPQPMRGPAVGEPMYWAGYGAPVRRVQTRSETGGRTVEIETVEGPDIEGRLTTFEEVVTETTREPGRIQTRQDMFERLTASGPRRLTETTESRQDTQPGGVTSTVHNTWVPDVNGRLSLSSRVVEEARSSAPDMQRLDTTVLRPGLNEPLRETERTETTTRRVSPGVVRHDRTYLVRDINGRWTPTETRQSDVRETGSSDRIEEETVQRRDVNGNVAVAEMNVIRSSRTQDQEQVVIETYAPQTDVWSSNGRPPLRERVRRTTTMGANGVRYTVEELEERSRVSASDPMRVVQRIVTTVTPTRTGESVTEQQVFELDANGRLRLVRRE